MAKTSKPPRGTKGTPTNNVTPNMEVAKDEETTMMNFTVPLSFKIEFKTYAAQRNIKMVDVLKEAFKDYKDRNP